jgi:membrane protein implicated in regulation of membrane protease activity
METIFLACFAFGLLFTVASVALGAAGSVHFGHFGHGGGHSGAHLGHGPAHAAHGPGHDAHIAHETAQGLPLLNASSALGGLTWFGAAGYVLLRLGDWALPGAILGALAAGALGWYLIARFLGLILRGEIEMDPDDYRLEGTVGQITVSIPEGGTGEVVFSKVDTRRSEAARALGGVAIPRGTEVVITSYQGGFATVQPWDEFVGAHEAHGAKPPSLAPTERHRS